MIRSAIIAILAAIGCWFIYKASFPGICTGPVGTPEGALVQDKRDLNDAIAFYAKDHNGLFPKVALFEQQLTCYADAAGNPSRSMDATHNLGPYIRRMPPLPLGVNKGASGVASPQIGWIYNEATGFIRGNCDQDNPTLARAKR